MIFIYGIKSGRRKKRKHVMIYININLLVYTEQKVSLESTKTHFKFLNFKIHGNKSLKVKDTKQNL